MQFANRTLDALALMIAGRNREDQTFFIYRSSSYLTKFFQDCDTDYEHRGESRLPWVAEVLKEMLAGAQPAAHIVPPAFATVIRVLMSPEDAKNEGPDRPGALAQLNAQLQREGFEAFYAEDGACYLRHLATRTVSGVNTNPHRPLSAKELERRAELEAYLDKASEDELIESVLLPLFRQIGFHRITNAGHTDKALEYGKDVWMKFQLPTMHWLYFGVQVKRSKLDSSGVTKTGHANVAEVLNQVKMMVGHEIFDPEVNRKVLVDHAFIVAGGEITKQARNWLVGQLDASQRREVIFMDRSDILDLFVVRGLPVPRSRAAADLDDDIPF